jgi:hypothetical protein
MDMGFHIRMYAEDNSCRIHSTRTGWAFKSEDGLGEMGFSPEVSVNRTISDMFAADNRAVRGTLYVHHEPDGPVVGYISAWDDCYLVYPNPKEGAVGALRATDTIKDAHRVLREVFPVEKGGVV